MAKPQLEDGYTPIANEIMEALSKIRIPGEAGQCLHFIIRKTYGYGKKEDWISLSQFVDGTNLLKPTVSRALRKLLGMNMIIKKDNAIGVTYGLQKDCDKWKPLSKKITVIEKDNKGSTKKIIGGSTKKIPTVNRYYKRNITKDKEPIDKFNSWVKENQDKIYHIAFNLVGYQFKEGSDYDKMVREEIRKMRAWIIGNPQKGNKKIWSRFIQGWLQKAIHDYQQLKNPLTNEKEKEHYSSKRK